MSGKNVFGNEVSVDEQAFEKHDDFEVDEDGFEVVDETPEFRATVKQETQAKVDANHPDGIADTSNERIHGVTLEQEERIQAREAELERISAQAELGTQDGREQRTREVVAERSAEQREQFQKRAASANPMMADPERADPRAGLDQDELAAVNKQAKRIAAQLDGWSRAMIGRRLGEAVASGKSLMAAVVGTFEALQTAPGRVVPIETLEDIDRKEVSVEGRVETLWDPSHPSIAQVGLIADDSGKTRVTIWKASDAPWVKEGERIRIHKAARNWYEGRVSLAVTGWTTIHFPERGRWWDE